jgi:hypothetical protein
VADFIFQTEAAGLLAVQALLDQVFVEVVDGQLPAGVTSDFAFYARFTPAQQTPVPEPTSLLLLGTGVAGIVAKASHRRRTK